MNKRTKHDFEFSSDPRQRHHTHHTHRFLNQNPPYPQTNRDLQESKPTIPTKKKKKKEKKILTQKFQIKKSK